jgi:hypothetical protein
MEETGKKVEMKPQTQKEKTISEKFMEELDPREKEIFLKIKEVRMKQCEYAEFEAVTEDTLDDYAFLITYVKEGVLTFESDGVVIKVRRPILSEKNEVIANSIKLLFQRNLDRERAFTKKIKVKPGDTAASMEYTRAVIAAHLANADFNGTSIVIPEKCIAGKNIHANDYQLLTTCYLFFRN